MYSLLLLTTGILFAAVLTDGNEITTNRYYQIKAFDKALLTVGGDNSAGVKIVTEETPESESDPRKAFWVGEGSDSHLLSPQSQNTFSTLVLGMQTEQKFLVFQQSHIIGATRQWWRIQDLGNNLWFIQNVKTGLCMSTAGKNTQPFGTVCDRSVANQTWEFIPISRSGKILTPEAI